MTFPDCYFRSESDLELTRYSALVRSFMQESGLSKIAKFREYKENDRLAQCGSAAAVLGNFGYSYSRRQTRVCNGVQMVEADTFS